MAILNDVTKKSAGAKVLVLSFYLILILGGITMVYPFLMMTSGAMKGHYNIKKMNVVPVFLYDDLELYRAWSESKYLRVANLNEASTSAINEFDILEPNLRDCDTKLADMYKTFSTQNPASEYERVLGRVEVSNSNLPTNGLAFINYLSDKYGDLESLNKKLDLNMPQWNAVMRTISQADLFQKGFLEVNNSLVADFIKFRQNSKPDDFYLPTVDGQFRQKMIFAFAGYNINAINEATGLNIKSISELTLSRNDGNAWYNKMRKTFILQFLNPRYINIKTDAHLDEQYRKFIKKEFKNSIVAALDVFPHIKRFAEIKCPNKLPKSIRQAILYNKFIEHEVSVDALELTGPQLRFRSYLKDKYKTIEALNDAIGSSFKSFDYVYIPQRRMDWDYVMANKSALRWDLATMNVKYVASYIFNHGRAAWVTLVFCLLTIITSLLVNPLAAYALSRYNLPSTYKVLMVLMATMAFPAAVTQIPSFLMLKDFHLLNTFWALILPTMANGYSVFILKGFFDSLPKELYEAASLDGASEVRLFFQITLNLSKPVLALIALQSFTAAYGNFMFALLICQDPSMWTIMVYIFQLQNTANQAVTFAALLLAAVPTFVIFVTCQNVIMRGIVVPSEK